MKSNVKFYKCNICENVIGLIDGNPQHLTCCGKSMEQMIPNSVDAATEKHVPICRRKDDRLIVSVGDVEHPMTEDHYIMWIAQVTDNQTTRVRLNPGEIPQAEFQYMGEAVIYAYCNKHGLWKTDVN